MLSEDGRHLDFRVSVLRRTGVDGGRELVLATTVHCHDLAEGDVARAMHPDVVELEPRGIIEHGREFDPVVPEHVPADELERRHHVEAEVVDR